MLKDNLAGPCLAGPHLALPGLARPATPCQSFLQLPSFMVITSGIFIITQRFPSHSHLIYKNRTLNLLST